MPQAHVAQVVKNPPTMQEMSVRSLGQEDPLEKEMAIHFSILPWEIPWTEEPHGLWSLGSQTVRHNLATKYPPTHTHTHTHIMLYVFQGNFVSDGNLLE